MAHWRNVRTIGQTTDFPLCHIFCFIACNCIAGCIFRGIIIITATIAITSFVGSLCLGVCKDSVLIFCAITPKDSHRLHVCNFFTYKQYFTHVCCYVSDLSPSQIFICQFLMVRQLSLSNRKLNCVSKPPSCCFKFYIKLTLTKAAYFNHYNLWL